MRKDRNGRIVIIAVVMAATSTCAVNVGAQGVRGFGVPPGKLPFRTFGNPKGEEALRLQFPEAAASISGDDRSLARKQISIADANGDGRVTEQEWAESGHQTPGHFRAYDLSGDGILTFYEHSIGIARWRRRNERRAEEQSSAQLAAARKRKAPTTPSAVLKEAPELNPQVAARREQVERLAYYLIRLHDINENGVVERGEFQNPSSRFGDVGSADHDRDGEIREDEMANWLHSRLPPLSRLSMELQSHDLDHDDQVTIHEFLAMVGSSSVAEFRRWDRNGDGFITPSESYLPENVPSTYENADSFVIKPRSSVVSDIWIEDQLRIDQLKVYVRITKETDNFTGLFLIGPRGKRVTLYAGDGWRPWNGALILKGVTFTDSAPLIRKTLKQPPYRRELRPPTGTKDELGLNSFNGESTRGRWRLIVRNQNDRAGLLLHWSLIITPKRVSG